MGSVYNFNQTEMLAFLLVLVRMSSFIISWPVFGGTYVPPQVKILFSLAFSFMIFSTVSWRDLSSDLASNQIIWLGAREAFIGLSLGFLARMFFFTINIGGDLIAVSMGLSNAQMFNPMLGERVSAVEEFKVILATLFFLSIDGHHLLIAGIVDSFRIVPLSPKLLSLEAFGGIGPVIQEIVIIGIKISAPVMVSVLFMNVALAVAGRAVPQINILITSLSVNILAGIFVLLIGLPLVIWQMHDIVEITTTRMFQFLRSY